jgi:hypothetical protein
MPVSIIFVDMDDTLALSSPWEKAPCVRSFGEHKARYLSPQQLQQQVCGPTDKIIVSEKKNVWVSRLRPGVQEFLAALRPFGRKVCILSYATDDFVRQGVSLHGLGGLVDDVYGRESFSSVPKVGLDALLIDDKLMTHSKSVEKLYAMGSIRSIWDLDKAEQVYVKVPPYTGALEDDGLARVLEDVARRLDRRAA